MAFDGVPLRYDAKAINSAVPIEMVYEKYVGPITGHNNMVHCPSRNHTDKTPSAHLYKGNCGNNCRCFSCSKSFSPISIVMEQTGMDFPKACQQLIDDFNLSIYSVSNASQVENYKNAAVKEKFPLSPEDCELIHIPSPFCTTVPNLNYSNDREVYEEAPEFFKIPSLYETWESDKASTEDMIIGICDERIDRYAAIIHENEDLFKSVFSLITKESEVKESEKLKEGDEKFNFRQGNIKMTDRQRELLGIQDKLQCISEDIASLEDKISEIEAIKQKVRETQKERMNNHKKEYHKPIDR